MIERPIHTVRSGPAMGPVAGRRYAELEDRKEAVLVVDTGGTTFDVSLVRDGTITITPTVAMGIGPLIANHIYDVTQSYAPVLWAALPGFLASALLFAALGPAPDFTGTHE